MARRRGRPARHYTTSWGETIVGLCRRANGRFYPVGRNDVAFGSDESLAVHRFRRWQAQTESPPAPPSLLLPLPLSPETLDIAFPDGDSDRDPDEPDDEFSPTMANLARVLGDNPVVEFAATLADIRRAERRRLRRLLLTDPRQAAQELDVPHVAHYPKIPAAPQFTLRQLGTFYLENKRNRHGERLARKHRKNSATWWRDFCEQVAVTYARDLTSELIRKYYNQVMSAFDKGASAAYVRSRFVQVRAILNYGLTHTEDRRDLRHALDLCAVLTPPVEFSDPAPISPADFQKLLACADGPMRAMLLLGLNAAMHNGEVAATLRRDVDLEAGTLSARRNKTRAPRVAKLWPRTIAAIKAYQAAAPQGGPHLFVSRTGRANTAERIRQRFVTLRRKAGVGEEVTFEGLRDAAYTVAEGIDAHHAKFLAGHKTGMSDRYVLRQANNPQVEACCAAIEQHFFGDPAAGAAGGGVPERGHGE